MVIGTSTFPRSIQLDDHSCGPRCVKSIVSFFGIRRTYDQIYRGCQTTIEGTPAIYMIEYLRSLGLKVGQDARMELDDLTRALERGPVLVYMLKEQHYAVVYGITPCYIYIADPDREATKGKKIRIRTFNKRWANWGCTISK